MEQMKRMDMGSTKIYWEYRRVKDKKTWTLMSLLGFAAPITLAIVCFAFGDRINKKFGLLLLAVSCVLCVAMIVLSVTRIKKLEKAKNIPYEYTVVKVDKYKAQEVMSVNGKKLKFDLSDKNTDFKDGEEAVVAYIPEAGFIYVEKIENWKKMGMPLEYNEIFVEETQVPVQEEAAVEQVYEEVLSGEITTVQLNQMTYDNAEKYYVYKNKYVKKDLFTGLILLNGILAVIAVLALVLSESFLHWLIPGISVLLMLIVIYVSVDDFIEQRKLLNEASKGSYEYAKVLTEFKQPTKFICSDGHEVKWTMEEGDMEKKNGQDAVVVYLKSVDKIYLESAETFNKIYGETM